MSLIRKPVLLSPDRIDEIEREEYAPGDVDKRPSIEIRHLLGHIRFLQAQEQAKKERSMAIFNADLKRLQEEGERRRESYNHP